MGSKAPQSPPPEYKVGDIVIAAVDIIDDADEYFPRRTLAKKGDQLFIRKIDQIYPIHVSHQNTGPHFGVSLGEITKPPRPTSPPPPRIKK